jgi:uncharacterized protein DUF4276
MPLRVVVVVEGHGEEEGAIRRLLERIWYELLGGDYIEIIPWRGKQGQLLKEKSFRDTVAAAAVKLHSSERTDLRRLLLVMIDTEGRAENCPKFRAHELFDWARKERSDAETEIACVLPNVMFETWFAAAAESLRGINGLPADLPKPEDPERDGLGKAWIKKLLPRKYKETVDQVKFVDHMSLSECAASSCSFRKLIKELRLRLPGSTAVATGTPHRRPVEPERPKPSRRRRQKKRRSRWVAMRRFGAKSYRVAFPRSHLQHSTRAS